MRSRSHFLAWNFNSSSQVQVELDVLAFMSRSAWMQGLENGRYISCNKLLHFMRAKCSCSRAQVATDSQMASSRGPSLISPLSVVLRNPQIDGQYDQNGNPSKSSDSNDLFDAFMIGVTHKETMTVMWDKLN